MTDQRYEDHAPDEPQLTAYDEVHLSDYLRLLDASAEGTDWREVVAIIFGLDPRLEPTRAKVVYDSHLARAEWMTRVGYAHLLGPPTH